MSASDSALAIYVGDGCTLLYHGTNPEVIITQTRSVEAFDSFQISSTGI